MAWMAEGELLSDAARDEPRVALLVLEVQDMQAAARSELNRARVLPGVGNRHG